jgi:hypothetical protein
MYERHDTSSKTRRGYDTYYTSARTDTGSYNDDTSTKHSNATCGRYNDTSGYNSTSWNYASGT